MGEEKKQVTWFDRYRQHPAGILALGIVVLFALMGVYAPFLASSKPLFVIYDPAAAMANTKLSSELS